MIVNTLPQNALNGVQTALSDILLLKEPNNSFALLNAASYIGPFVDIKQLDVLFNQITNISICLKQCGQHWTWAKEKKPFGHAITHWSMLSIMWSCIGFVSGYRCKFSCCKRKWKIFFCFWSKWITHGLLDVLFQSLNVEATKCILSTLITLKYWSKFWGCSSKAKVQICGHRFIQFWIVSKSSS